MKNRIKLAAKILELLGEGFLLSLSKDRNYRRKLHQNCDRIWYTVDRKQLYKILDRFHLQGLIETIKQADGIEKVKLTNPGITRNLKYQFKNLKIKELKHWDKKWRIVVFDIPEIKRRVRDSLRNKLKQLDFLEFQKSVFVFPYPCEDEINFIINFYGIAENVYILESSIRPDHKLRKHFNL